jgi:hypothetical protein
VLWELSVTARESTPHHVGPGLTTIQLLHYKQHFGIDDVVIGVMQDGICTCVFVMWATSCPFYFSLEFKYHFTAAEVFNRGSKTNLNFVKS